MKRMMFAFFTLSLSLVLFSGCFSDSKTSSGVPAVCADPDISDTTGTYYTSSFTYVEDGVNYSPCIVYLYILTQDGGIITGTTSADCSGNTSSSIFNGRICGSSVSGQGIDNSDYSVSNYTGSITASSITVSFTGSDGYSSWSGSGTLNKQ